MPSILIIDDTASNLEALSYRIGKAKSSHVICCETMEQAHTAIDNFPDIWLVFLDLRMPGVDPQHSVTNLRGKLKEVGNTIAVIYSMSMFPDEPLGVDGDLPYNLSTQGLILPGMGSAPDVTTVLAIAENASLLKRLEDKLEKLDEKPTNLSVKSVTINQFISWLKLNPWIFGFLSLLVTLQIDGLIKLLEYVRDKLSAIG